MRKSGRNHGSQTRCANQAALHSDALYAKDCGLLSLKPLEGNSGTERVQWQIADQKCHQKSHGVFYSCSHPLGLCVFVQRPRRNATVISTRGSDKANVLAAALRAFEQRCQIVVQAAVVIAKPLSMRLHVEDARMPAGSTVNGAGVAGGQKMAEGFGFGHTDKSRTLG